MCDQLQLVINELPATAPASICSTSAAVLDDMCASNNVAETTPNIVRSSKRNSIKRGRSLDALNESADSDTTAAAKKPRGRRPKAATAVGKPSKLKSRSSKKCSGKCDDDAVDTAANTESLPVRNAQKTEKTVAETIAEGMTSFIATVTANISSLHSKLQETQEAVLQLTAQLSEIQELRDAVVQLSTQHNVLKELRDAVTSAHRSEVQQLRDVVQQQITTQQQELRQLRDVVQQTSTQLGEFRTKQDVPLQPPTQPSSGSATHQSQHQQSQQSMPVLRWRANPPVDRCHHVLDEAYFPQLSRAHNEQQRQQDTALKQDLVAAMYIDMDRKQRRANNVVISGLECSRGSDKKMAHDLLVKEFAWNEEDEGRVVITNCRRIGKQWSDKVQPLLVTLESRQQAAYFLANFKRLRCSTNAEVKEKVFISADLTPAEAKAAYELRCRRRGQQPNRQTGQQQQQQHHAAEHNTSHSQNTAIDNTSQSQQSCVQSSSSTGQQHPITTSNTINNKNQPSKPDKSASQ